MNALLDLTIYDKRRGKTKELKYDNKQLVDNKRNDKLKTKSLNRNDKVNKATRTEKSKKDFGKSRENLTLDNSHFGSVISLANDIPKSTNSKNKTENNKIKVSEIDASQLRQKPAKKVEASGRTENIIQDAINGFNYTGSIELKFEEALEVCSDNLYDEIDEEFGRNLFDDESDNYILEAYNKPGDELVETYIEVEHRTEIIPTTQKEEIPKVKPVQLRTKEIAPEKSKDSLCFISDNEECIFVEAYNSMGYEFRKTYGLIDRSLSNISLDEDFQKSTLSITSDVQQYFNDIETKCESEDLQPTQSIQLAQPTANTYMNYSRIIDEYRKSRQAASLKKANTYMNYSRIIDEYRKSRQAASLKKTQDSNSNSSTTGACDVQNIDLAQPSRTTFVNYSTTGACDVQNIDLAQPSRTTFVNYNRMVDEFRKSQQIKPNVAPSVIKKNNVARKTIEESDDARSVSSDEQVYEMPHQDVNVIKFIPQTKSDFIIHELLETEMGYVNNLIKFIPQTKSDFIIHELLETEMGYVNNLRKILTDYLSYFRKFPDHLQTNVDIIFGNIQQIYDQTMEFYHALLMCSNDYEAIALTFIDYKNLFKLYPIYMKNKPQADRILIQNYKSVIEDRQKKLKDRLDLMSYLLNPIQRLGRYILLLENLQKSVRRSACLDPAIEILKSNMTKGNDSIAVESILKVPLDPAIEILKSNMTKGNDSIAVESILKVPETVDLYKKGSYIDREKFVMLKPRRQEAVIFLFEDIVVFTTENVTSRRDVHTTFTYTASIDMNDLSITIVDGEMQTFQLIDYPKCKKNKDEASYLFEARDRKTRDHWGTLIQGRLWAQLEKFKDQSRSYKPVSRANSTSSAKIPKYLGQMSSHISASTSVSRENSTKSKTNISGDKYQKSVDRTKRRVKKPKSDAVKRTSKFYTDTTSLQYNKTM
ncbi:RhoGEF domain [Popillia japonica]|uniref:RhoGEF domain n=1 Tax=Popillia japonica TaxID=7064 RepID=A0AAW1L9F8_POPJA